MTKQIVPIPTNVLPEFDELHAISDLHLGGPPGFQIFNAGAELKGLIDHLRLSPPQRRVALVINGDFVDFLAEKDASHFEPVKAIEKLNRIVGDPSFALVWTALQEFAKTENRSLIINLGNHDLELALPWVRQRLLEILAGNDLSARGRITFSLDGTGVYCRVGKATVLCVHGNEVDDWNLADYETLRRLGRDIVQGRPVDEWQPNAGAKMVIDVMNGLKKDFPFIDLLKPEKEALLPTLVALAPNEVRKLLDDLALVKARQVQDSVRRRFGFLSAEEDARPVLAAAPLKRNQSQAEMTRQTEALWQQTEDWLNEDVQPLDLIKEPDSGEMLGIWDVLVRKVRGKIFGEAPEEALRNGLSELLVDRSFDFAYADPDTFKPLDQQVSSDIDFLIAGHTHLERALRRKQGRGYYFNSGTWARLIQLTPADLQNAGRFHLIYQALAAGSMQALDVFPNLVLRRLTVVSIWVDNDQTHGELRRVNELSGTAAAPPTTTVGKRSSRAATATAQVMQAVPNTRFAKA